MFGLKDQYKRPTGLRGKFIASKMNKNHAPLTLWGLSYVNIESDYVILDVGSGGGATVNWLAQRAFKGKVFGIDYSADMVEYSKKINKKLITQNRVEIIEGSVGKMGFSDNLFDLVTAIETYYFWPNFTEALQEIKRVLKPDGKLLMVNEMVKDGVYEIKNAKLIQKTQVRLFSLEEIKDIIQSVGFGDVQIFTKDKTPWNAILAEK